MAADPVDPFEPLIERQRLLVLGGTASVVLGIVFAAWVAYEWVVYTTSHVVIALLSGVAVIFGVQLLVFSFMATMLITLHEEQRSYLGAETDSMDGPRRRS